MLSKLMTATMLVLLAIPGTAENMPVPYELQAELFKRIFSYDKTLADRKETVVYIAYSQQDSAEKNELVRAFDKTGVLTVAVDINNLQDQEGSPTAVYLFPNSAPDVVKQFCSEKGVLSISGVASFANSGDVSIGLVGAENRTQIIVNMNRLKVEGHVLSAQLLKLAKVIR